MLEILREKARKLRKRQTPFEQKLWYYLRRQNLGARFRRQVPIQGYIVDFISYKPRMVVEIDGDSHAFQIKYDNKRDAFFKNQGYKVLRFTNRDIQNNLMGVLETIANAIGEFPHPASPIKGEEKKYEDSFTGKEELSSSAYMEMKE